MASPSFLSYSRKDYYFAESLAFHLLRRGVPIWLDVRDLDPGKDWERSLEDALDAAATVVLVVSPDSMKSPHVRNEWERALRQGKTIILARFRRAKVPDELQQCESVNFQFAFGRALRKLVARLAPPVPASIPQRTSGGSGAGIAVPPWVALMAITLGVPSVGYLLLARWAPDPSASVPTLVHWTVLPIMALLLLWFFCLTYLRRQMGMTRLASCLVCLAGIFAMPIVLFGFLGEIKSLTYDESVVRMARDHWRAGVVLASIPLTGLVVLVLFRPEDLLRWAPTGTAWSGYRIGHVADAVFARAYLGTQFSLVRQFSMWHDPVDAPMAERLRRQLGAQGATEIATDSATTVLLLSNRTRTAWLDQQTERLPEAMLTVVGTSIRVPDSLERLWRRQWIDFRRWDPRRADREKALPQVPEAVSGSRVPAVISHVHQLLCALAALLAVLAGKVDESSRASDDLNPAQIAAGLGALWWGLLARRFLRRSRVEANFARDCVIGWVATLVGVAWCGYTMAARDEPVSRLLLVGAFLIVALVWLLRQRTAIAFWFPAERAGRESPQQSLAPGRNWRTLIVLTVYLFVWYLVLVGGT